MSDDAAVGAWAGLAVRLVEGSETNLKLTTADDLVMAKRALTAENSKKFLAAAMQRPEFSLVSTTFVPAVPQIFASVDRENSPDCMARTSRPWAMRSPKIELFMNSASVCRTL